MLLDVVSCSAAVLFLRSIQFYCCFVQLVVSTQITEVIMANNTVNCDIVQVEESEESVRFKVSKHDESRRAKFTVNYSWTTKNLLLSIAGTFFADHCGHTGLGKGENAPIC